MYVIITGAKGLLGDALTKLLSSVGDIQSDGVDVDELDITDATAVRDFIGLKKPDVVINLAAYTAVDKCETEYEKAYRVNAIGARNLAKAAASVKSWLVHISTDYVFDGKKGSPYTEEDIPNPLNAYGRTKLAGEKAILEGAAKATIIRTAWLYGPNGVNFVDKIRSLARTESRLRVVNDQRGSPTYTFDLARAILHVVNNRITGIINATNSGSCTWFELAQEVVKLEGLNTPVIPITTQEAARPAPRPAYSVLDLRRLAKSGLIMRHWREALIEYIRGQNPA